VATVAPSLAGSSEGVDLLLLTLEGVAKVKDAHGEASDESAAAAALADAVVTHLLTSLAAAYRGKLAAQLLLQDRPTRRLADTTPAPTAYNATQLTVSEIANYQICLWTGVVLVLAVLSAVCCLVNMDIRPDSLLYAKFQADVSSKLE
jgi:hypothetical protein